MSGSATPSPFSGDQTWLTLGGLDLPAGDPDAEAGGWLARTLDGLQLRPDLLEKLSRAVQTASRRDDSPLRLVVYASAEHPDMSHNWGFFLIEKADPLPVRIGGPQRTIELYLYREGR